MCSIAEQLTEWVGNASAWNLPTFFALRVKRKVRNQYGIAYTFTDKSGVFVRKGTGKVVLY